MSRLDLNIPQTRSGSSQDEPPQAADDVGLHVLGCRVDILGTNCTKLLKVKMSGGGQIRKLKVSAWILPPSQLLWVTSGRLSASLSLDVNVRSTALGYLRTIFVCHWILNVRSTALGHLRTIFRKSVTGR